MTLDLQDSRTCHISWANYVQVALESLLPLIPHDGSIYPMGAMQQSQRHKIQKIIRVSFATY